MTNALPVTTQWLLTTLRKTLSQLTYVHKWAFSVYSIRLCHSEQRLDRKF